MQLLAGFRLITEMWSNKQHLRTYFGQTEQFGDVFVVKTNAAI